MHVQVTWKLSIFTSRDFCQLHGATHAVSQDSLSESVYLLMKMGNDQPFGEKYNSPISIIIRGFGGHSVVYSLLPNPQGPQEGFSAWDFLCWFRFLLIRRGPPALSYLLLYVSLEYCGGWNNVSLRWFKYILA